ncbi:EAL domain-containing protein [Sphaerochaeta pleomorpha str. Grapes]|uniref:EAL domain-containing protein n=1 Tax=Sphaerochaeta pleomorpha (strain ATCC BAA-1885 / DSM 22778 / Grapes) TaxID=158190 RepID=G8QQ62_SPHPG|nr:GGDEF domain-containing phosphodiesterase [Sphaerochaeta pleomorpha]AEV28639.1 EAL domain-containing protein [Sphaerochaeta pleomorpha str. Grapes]
MNRKAVAPAILLIVDEPDTKQKVFVDKLSDFYGIVVTSTRDETVLKSGRGYLSVFLADLLSPTGYQTLALPMDARYILVVVSEPNETRFSDRSLLPEDSAGKGLACNSLTKDLVRWDSQQQKTYGNVGLLLEKTVATSECHVFSALFTYFPHSLRLLSAQSGLLSFLQASSVQELQSSLPNFLHLLNEKACVYFEASLAKAKILQKKVLFSFMVHKPDIPGFAQLQLAFTPMPYPSPSGTEYLMECTVFQWKTPIRHSSNARGRFAIPNREAFYDNARALLFKEKESHFLYVRWQILQFQQYIEHYGRVKGEHLLLHCAMFLDQWLAKIGTFGHLYSDHFAFVLSEKDFDPAVFLQESNRALGFSNQYLDLPTALGIARVSDDSIPLDRINKMAKLALYSATNGHSEQNFAFFEIKKGEESLRNQRLSEEIPSALKTLQIGMHLQPVFNLKEQKFVSAEALARWNHPTLGLLSPKVFIPLFEKRKMILELDLSILESVCVLQQSLVESGIEPLPISVNLSQLDFYDSTLFETILTIVDNHFLSHELICFEITESTSMDDPKQLLKTLELLRAQGFILLLDDYGSGYSSLRLLTSSPIDILKIDMEFTQQIGTSSRVETALQNIVTMAKNLGVGMIAEGVENKAQADFFQSIGCNQIQGYLYSKPLPVQAYRLFLQTMK